MVDLLIPALRDNREADANLLTDYQQSMARADGTLALDRGNGRGYRVTLDN